MADDSKLRRKIITYYEKSKLGYDIVLFGAKHFGYYPNKRVDISPFKARDLMQELIAKKLGIKQHKLILDAGCGQGVVSRYLANKYGCKIDGITIVPYELERAKIAARSTSLDDKLHYYLMDYSNTEFKPNRFDSIYAVESFCHSTNTTKTLKEFLRILKPNGKLVIFDYTIAQDNKFTKHEKEMLDMVIEVAGMWSTKNMRIGKFTTTLRKIGFKSVNEQDITEHVVPSIQYLRSLAIFPYHITKLLGMEKKFINITIPNELYVPIKKGLIRYCVFTATK